MTVEAGQIVSGKVTGITNFGAFVSLPNDQSGLVHISEVSEGFVKDINDYLSVGDEIQVKVLKLSPDGKINLSIRQVEGNSSSQAKTNTQNTEPKQVERPNFRNNKQGNRSQSKNDDFDAMMNQFLKDSEDRLSSLKRSTEGKRGGRGGRRN